MALVERYVDPSAPDGGDGSYGNPWSSQDTATALSHVTYPDLQVNLKRGLIYKPQGASVGGLWLVSKKPAGNWRFRSYGDAEMPPTFFSGTNMLPGDTGWTHVGSGLWKKTLNNNGKTNLQQSMRLYVGGSRLTGPVSNLEGGTGYVFGTARARYALLGDVTDSDVLAEIGTMGATAPRIWTYAAAAAGAVGTLYVWTGSVTLDPPTYYDGITLVGANGATDVTGFGRANGLGMWGCSNTVISECDSIFAPTALRAYGRDSDNFNAGFEHCSGLAYGTVGLILEGVSGFTAYNYSARDTLVDAIATYDEEWNFRDKYVAPFTTWINGSQDAITVGRWTNACLLERVICRDGYHGNIFIGGQNSSGSQTTVGARVVDVEVSNPGRLYGAAMGVVGLGVGNVATITRLKAHDLVQFFGVGGSGQSVWNDCVFYDAKRPYPIYDATNGANVNSIPAIVIQPASASWGDFEAGCITMNRCTVMQPYGFMMNFNKDGLAGTTPPGVMVVNDSAFVDTRWINDSAARTYAAGIYDKPGISIAANASTPAGALVANNSYFYTGAAGQLRVSTENSDVGNKTFAAWAGLVGTFNEADPKVDAIGRPLIGSPLLNAGTSAVTRRRDVEGKQRPNPPSIGAYDVATLRKRLVTDPAPPEGTIYYAASLSAADVQAAFNLATSDGDTVVLPAGSANWATQVTWNAPSNATLRGAGDTSRGGGDATIIQDNYASDNALLAISTDAVGTFTMEGVTIRGGNANTAKYNGVLNIGGSTKQLCVRHCNFDMTTYSPSVYAAAVQVNGWVYGVVYECIVDNPIGSVNNAFRMFNKSDMNGDALGVGDQSWAAPTALGSEQFIFVEDCDIHHGAGNDASSGGTFVFRYNAFTMSAPVPSLQTHPTGGGQRHRGARAWEIYGNTFTAASAQYINEAIWLSSGTGVVWGNTAPSSSAGGGTGYKYFIGGHDMRYDNSTYTQSATPAGWGYCGTDFNGTGSNWDGNTNTSTGYPAIDQLGRGQGQLLVNDFPSTLNNSTGTIAWPNQALEPIYEWDNAWDPVPSSPAAIWAQDNPVSAINRDYYCGTNDSGNPITFTGATGVGRGLLSARPSSGLTAGVGYWATDTQTLYVATGSTTWATWYQPYAYPHPLRS